MKAKVIKLRNDVIETVSVFFSFMSGRRCCGRIRNWVDDKKFFFFFAFLFNRGVVCAGVASCFMATALVFMGKSLRITLIRSGADDKLRLLASNRWIIGNVSAFIKVDRSPLWHRLSS